jgi:GMP synthase (glutamine-hydrolysing)
MDFDKILILDFGSQYTQLIARRIRELNVYSEIFPYNVTIEKIKEFSPKGIILSGGPSSVYEKNAPVISKEIFQLNVPVLGICYGIQLISFLFQGGVEKSNKHEYGFAILNIKNKDLLFKNLPDSFQVWMSHGDKINKLPKGFEIVAYTDNSSFAAIRNLKSKIWGVQFHPEVVHTNYGKDILKNFCFEICQCLPNWNIGSFLNETVENIKNMVKTEKVICGLSGGVDSSVVAVLIHKAIGEQLTCIFVNNGVLRKNESEKVKKIFKDNFKINLLYVDAENIFLEKLKGVTDPEQKRKIIGNTFIEIFEKEAKKLGNVKFLAQGTLYPDVIESVSFKGPSATIKSHHNVGGLPEKMNLKLIEPLRELFKDEVRALGLELGMPEEIIYRQPFPGPGLAIRIIGEVTKERLDILREADDIILSEIKDAGLYREIWQSFGVLLPVKTVGVMGDERTYENVIAIRAVNSVDGMTADWVKLPYELLGKISNRIINEIRGVNRVVYDISSKPPATIEWE